MSNKITACPKYDQCENVSATLNPVTQEALVAVKSADRKFTLLSRVANGRHNTAVPKQIIAKKLIATIAAAGSLNFLFAIVAFIINL